MKPKEAASARRARRGSSDFSPMDVIALRPPMGAERDGSGARLRMLRVVSAWSRAVGPQARTVSMPIAFRSRRLLVQVTDTAWGRELDRLKPEILRRMATLLPSEPIEAITFRAGPSVPRPRAVAPPSEQGGPHPSGPGAAPVPDIPDLSAPLQLVVDPELRDMLRGVARRYLERSRRFVS